MADYPVYTYSTWTAAGGECDRHIKTENLLVPFSFQFNPKEKQEVNEGGKNSFLIKSSFSLLRERGRIIEIDEKRK